MEVVTSCTPQTFVERLFERINIVAEVEELGDITEIRTTNFEISCFANADDAISVELGILPNVFVEFRPKPSLQTDLIAVKRLMEATDKWLHFIDNDMVMVYNGESVMMYRKQGKLRVNAASKGWTPARLSLITYPYETVEMPALRETTED
jgi:hypothetical protein